MRHVWFMQLWYPYSRYSARYAHGITVTDLVSQSGRPILKEGVSSTKSWRYWGIWVRVLLLKFMKVPKCLAVTQKNSGIWRAPCCCQGANETSRRCWFQLCFLWIQKRNICNEVQYLTSDYLIVLSNFDSPYLVGLVAITLNPFSMVMELCPYGDLHALLHKV